MKKPLLSIVVPAYNAELTIGKLIDSLILQNYNDYELIIVNDGSTDKTLEIITGYSKKYSYIHIIDKPNTGRGDTRNRGMEIANGKYIAFADSDDYYCDNFFETIIPELEKGNFDLLVFNANKMNDGKYAGSVISDKYQDEEFVNHNGVIDYLSGKNSYKLANCPWNKIYVTKIIRENNLKYNIYKKRGQDLLFNMLYMAKISDYKYINKKLYNYNLNFNLLKNKKYFDNYIEHNLEYYDPIKEICEMNNIKDYEKYMGIFFLKCFFSIIINEKNNPNKKQKMKNIKRYLENKSINYILKKIELKDLNFKLLMQYILFKLYKFIV